MCSHVSPIDKLPIELSFFVGTDEISGGSVSDARVPREFVEYVSLPDVGGMCFLREIRR